MGVPQMGNAMNAHPMTPHLQVKFIIVRAFVIFADRSFSHVFPQQSHMQFQMGNKGGMPQRVGGLNMPGNVGSPASSDPSFNIGGPNFPGGPNRMGPNKMMPPPSPGMNGPPKDQNNGPGGGANNGKNQNINPPNNGQHPDGSPRNQPPNNSNNSGQTPNAGGTGPPTPAPNNQLGQQQGPGPGQGQGQNMVPSPSSILGVPPPMNTTPMGGQGNLSAEMATVFPSDFIHSVASSLETFDTNPVGGIFGPEGDINFERDFGQWFSQDDVQL
jgi:collagen type III alpha